MSGDNSKNPHKCHAETKHIFNSPGLTIEWCTGCGAWKDDVDNQWEYPDDARKKFGHEFADDDHFP